MCWLRVRVERPAPSTECHCVTHIQFHQKYLIRQQRAVGVVRIFVVTATTTTNPLFAAYYTNVNKQILCMRMRVLTAQGMRRRRRT